MIRTAPPISISTPAVNSPLQQAPRRQRPGREFIAYLGASAAALALDTVLFRLSLAAGLPVAISAAAGFAAGLVLVYLLSSRFVFRQHRLKNASAEFVVFGAIGLAGLGLTELLLAWMIGSLALPPVAAKLTTACAVFLFNFTVRRLVLFTADRTTVHA